jgi:hypothetical protein
MMLLHGSAYSTRRLPNDWHCQLGRNAEFFDIVALKQRIAEGAASKRLASGESLKPRGDLHGTEIHLGQTLLRR